MKRGILLLVIIAMSTALFAQTQPVKIALLKYRGGGDWYADPTALPNLIQFCNEKLNTNVAKNPVQVEVGSQKIFDYPFVHMTGHGNVLFSESEANNLKKYLLAGGFLHIDDNYGMDQYIREELKKVFPDKELQELAAQHPIFHQSFNFPEGLPKIHEHDNEAPRAYGYFHDDRLVCLYTYESDISDGWEDKAVHNDPQSKRLKALRMGANILEFCFTH